MGGKQQVLLLIQPRSLALKKPKVFAETNFFNIRHVVSGGGGGGGGGGGDRVPSVGHHVD